jgi:hypothetical protein
MALVKLDWYRRTVSDKLLKTEYIIQQMDVNAATFATPNPALADVGTPPRSRKFATCASSTP